jgi:4'-phosphopantetheinyl transferase
MLNTVYLFDSACAENRPGLSKVSDRAIEERISYGRLLTLLCLTDCGLDVRNVNIRKDAYGKPYQDVDSGIHFNLSHSNNVFVCVASEQPVGIDIEKSKTYNLDAKKKRFFSEFEWALLTQKNEATDFFELWTCKESYAKFIGLGMRLPFSTFTVKKDNYGYEVEDPARGRTCLTTFRYNTTYRIAVCSKRKVNYTIKRVNTESLINIFPKSIV